MIKGKTYYVFLKMQEKVMILYNRVINSFSTLHQHKLNISYKSITFVCQISYL
jgi:hypothetical protein